MKVTDALQGVSRLFLDTAPVIYYVEANPDYIDVVTPIFDLIDNGALTAVTSPITLAECLVAPLRAGPLTLQQDFSDLILDGNNTEFALIDADCAQHAAWIRAQHGLSLLDALQVAVAAKNRRDALLTNDVMLRRVVGLGIVLVDELEL